MKKVIGDYREGASPRAHLTLTFYPEDFPVHWRRAGLTADFAAQWFGDAGEGLADGIAYALNELVENAIKFGSKGQVVVQAGVDGDELLLLVQNQMPNADVPRLVALLEETVGEDPWELMVRRVEANADDPNSSRSGLGFLTLLTDYGARLGWLLESGGDGERDDTRLHTMVRLAIQGG